MKSRPETTSAYVDFDPAIALFGNAFGCWHGGFALAATDRFNMMWIDPTLNEQITHALRTLQRQLVIELDRTGRIAMSDDQDRGRCVPRFRG